MTLWEYRTVALPLPQGFFSGGGQVQPALMDQVLNQWGGAGWELVNVMPTSRIEGPTAAGVAFFKRPRPAAVPPASQ